MNSRTRTHTRIHEDALEASNLIINREFIAQARRRKGQIVAI